MKTHLTWMRVTATAVLVAGVGVHEAAAQYAPYRPIPQQPATSVAAAPAAPATAPAAPQQAQVPPAQNPATAYTAYRTQPATSYPTPSFATSSYPTTPTPAYATSQPTPAYASPTGAQYTQPAAAYPQHPQTVGQYPQTAAQQYPANYGAYPYVAQQPTSETMPAPKNTSAAQPTPNGTMMAAPAGSMHANGANMSGAQAGACGCNTAHYGAGDYYTTPGYGSGPSGGYPNCGVGDYMGEDCNENQWFGGVYALGMTRTDATPVKLTSQMPTGGTYPYYPQPAATILTNRDVDFDYRAGVEIRFGSTFTIGEPCNTCQSSCGYNTGCGSNSCTPQTMYAWEVAFWAIDNSPDETMVMFNGTDRIYGMKSFVGLEYDRDGAGAGYAYRPVNDYYDYQMPITAPPAPSDGYVRVLSQRVRTDFRAQNLELNFIRFPMCSTGCSTGCATGGCSGGYDACGCNTNYTGCDESYGGGFAMYGSCGVRYFRIDDDFMYGTEFGEWNTGAYDRPVPTGAGGNNELYYNVDVDNELVGPQIGWTSDYCWHKWNLFCNSTFGIFDNHSSVWSRMRDGDGNWTRFTQDGSNFDVRSSKDSVAFLGELRVGTTYDFSCHWRGVIAYRAIALTGVATADEQLQNNYADRYSVGIIDSDNSMIVHGAQVGAECRY